MRHFVAHSRYPINASPSGGTLLPILLKETVIGTYQDASFAYSYYNLLTKLMLWNSSSTKFLFVASASFSSLNIEDKVCVVVVC